MPPKVAIMNGVCIGYFTGQPFSFPNFSFSACQHVSVWLQLSAFGAGGFGRGFCFERPRRTHCPVDGKIPRCAHGFGGCLSGVDDRGNQKLSGDHFGSHGFFILPPEWPRSHPVHQPGKKLKSAFRMSASQRLILYFTWPWPVKSAPILHLALARE